MNGDREIRDLAPLDPRADPRRWEAMVQGINHAAAGELRRRGTLGDPGILGHLTRWRVPTLTLSATLAAAAAVVLLLVPPAVPTPDAGLGAAVGYPDAVAEWVVDDRVVSVEELLFAMEEVE